MARLPWLAAALLLAGCVAEEPVAGPAPAPAPALGPDAPPAAAEPPTDAPSSPAPVAANASNVMPWNLLDCVFVYGTVTVPAKLLEGRLPEGFSTAVARGAGGDTLAQVGFEIDDCAEGSGIEGQIAPMTYASTWTPAIAPEDLAVEGAVGMFVNWDVLVPDDERRALMQSFGTPAHAGEIEVSADLRAGIPTTPFAVDYRFEDAGAFHFDIIPQPGTGAVGGSGGEFAQYTAGADGSLTFWRTKWAAHTTGGGIGTITLDPESWQAEAFGATTLPARFTFGTWDYTDGMIQLPS